MRVAFITSGSGATLQHILSCTRSVKLHFSIELVLTDRECKALEVAEAAGVASRCVEADRLSSSEEVSKRMMPVLQEFAVDAILLSYNRLVTDPILSRWWGRIINMHPSLLPAYRGFGAVAGTHSQALFGGASIHQCVSEPDAGPLIIQTVIPLWPEMDQAELRAKIFRAQCSNAIQALEWIAEGRLKVTESGRAVVVGAQYGAFPTNPAIELAGI